MATKREKQLVALLLKERIEHATGKKVFLEGVETVPQTETYVPAKGLSDESEPRPNRMKKPGERPGGWRLMSYSRAGGYQGGLYIQDEMSSMLIDKYGKERGERNFEGILNAPRSGAFFQYGTQIASEKAWLLSTLGIKYDAGDYFQYSYYDLWKEWMKRNGNPVKIAEPVVPQPAAIVPEPEPIVPPEPVKPTRISTISPEPKDMTRVAALAQKPNSLRMAQVMADKITDAQKAYRRGLAAEHDNQHDMADIFFNRAKDLGITSLNEEIAREDFLKEMVQEGYARFDTIPVVIKRVQDACAEIGVSCEVGKTEKRPVGYGSMRTSCRIKVGPGTIFIKNDKVPGMSAGEPETFLLNFQDPNKGQMLFSLHDLAEKIKTWLASAKEGPVTEPAPQMMSKQEVTSLKQDIRQERQHVSDDEAYDLAANIIAENPGLKEYLASINITDAQGHVADWFA